MARRAAVHSLPEPASFSANARLSRRSPTGEDVAPLHSPDQRAATFKDRETHPDDFHPFISTLDSVPLCPRTGLSSPDVRFAVGPVPFQRTFPFDSVPKAAISCRSLREQYPEHIKELTVRVSGALIKFNIHLAPDPTDAGHLHSGLGQPETNRAFSVYGAVTRRVDEVETVMPLGVNFIIRSSLAFAVPLF